MPEITPKDDVIEVKGSRPKSNAELDVPSDFSPVVPISMPVGWESGSGGGEAAKKVYITKQGGNLFFASQNLE